jgi:uncharacterized OsmC-like protein
MVNTEEDQMRKARTNRDNVANAIETAIEQATLAYQFSPGSYTASALGACLDALEASLAIPQPITTIDAVVNMTKGEREALHQARKQQKRRKQGMKPRAEYLAASVQQATPWKADGVSRATWYRRQRQPP